MARLKYIFDVDHTLFRYPPERLDYYQQAGRNVLRELVPGLDYDDPAAALMRRYCETGSETLLRQFTQERGMESKIKDFLRCYHEQAIAVFKGKLPRDARLSDTFNAIAPGDKVIVTHATSEWTMQVLEDIGMKDSMDPAHILTQDNPFVRYRKKHADECLFEDVEKLAGQDAKGFVMFDDMPENHVIPHRRGMETVLVHWSEGERREYPHVKRQHHDFAEFFEAPKKKLIL